MLQRGSKSAKKEAPAKAPAKAAKAPAKAAAKAKAAPKPKKVGAPPSKSDIYTVMLALSFLALLIGSVFLYLEGQRYGWDTKGNNARAQVTPAFYGLSLESSSLV